MTTEDDAISPEHKRITQAVGKALRRVREDLGLTRKDLAARLDSGIGERTLLSYELGHRQLTMGRFTELCRAMGVHPAVVFADVFRTTLEEWENGKILVDVIALTKDREPGFQPVRQWGRNRLERDSSLRFVELESAAVRELAAVVGCSPYDLAMYLTDITSPRKDE